MDEAERKIRELFGDKLKNDDIYYKHTDDGNLIVAQGEDGKDIVMQGKNIISNDDPRLKRFKQGPKFGEKSMEEMLQLDMDLVKKLTSKEAKEEQKQKDEARRMKKFMATLEKEGIDPDSAVAKQRMKVYNQTKDLIRFPRELEVIFNDNEIEEYADDLTIEEKEAIRKAKSSGLMISPEMILGSKRTNDLIAMTSKTGYNDFYWMDFVKYLSSHHNIDITTIRGDEEFFNQLFPEYLKFRRPPLYILIDKCIHDLEENMLADMKADENKNDSLLIQYRDDVEVRKAVVKEAKPYKMEDFRIFLYYFLQFGRHEEDSEYFNPNYSVSKGVKMSHYINKFKERTGFDFLDVYYHYYKLAEEKEFEKTGKANDKDEVYGKEDIDEVSVNKKDKIEDISSQESLSDFMGDIDFD